ncbi:MAG TPA: hypothetical protein VFT64_03555 [Rickettsiales bacterium]|nr:hypothetical protein [Rickettsiales bacterium]
MKNLLGGVALAVLVSACSNTPSQNQYSSNEVGQAITISYALVVGVKQVDIAGSASGAPIGSTPLGSTPYIGSQIDGIIQSAGSAAQQAESTRKGYEYTVVTEDKATKTVVQWQNPGDIIFENGDIVMLQDTGTFHRLLPTSDLPKAVLTPHKKKLEAMYDDTPPPSPPPSAESASTPPPAQTPAAARKESATPPPPPPSTPAPAKEVSPSDVALPIPAPGSK